MTDDADESRESVATVTVTIDVSTTATDREAGPDDAAPDPEAAAPADAADGIETVEDAREAIRDLSATVDALVEAQATQVDTVEKLIGAVGHRGDSSTDRPTDRDTPDTDRHHPGFY
jgi:hypothetical protein